MRLAVPADSFPPFLTVYGYFAAGRDDGTLARLHDVLRAQVRAAACRGPDVAGGGPVTIVLVSL